MTFLFIMSTHRKSENMSISSGHNLFSMGSFLLSFLMPLDELPPSRFPQGFTKEDFEFSKLYKCVLKEGCKAMRKLFRTVYSQPDMNTDNGKMGFGKYLKENCKKTQKYIKDKYKRYGLLDSNLMEEDFDISFGYIIIEETCIVDEERKFISEELWKEAEWLKIYRNKLAHIYGFMNGDLDNCLNNLCDHLRNIYELLEKEFSISCKTEINDMKTFIEESKLFEIRQDDMISYIQDVKKFWDDNIVSMIINGRNEIFKKNSKGIYLIDSYLESLNPCTFFVDDRIKKLNILDNFVIPKILKNKTSFDLKDIFATYDDKFKYIPKVIYMEGKNNSGKTSLCKFLLHSWATDKNSVIRRTDFDLAFYINVFSLKSNSLEAVFKHELLSKTTNNFQDKHIIPTLQDLDVLFLIDGFEERSDQTNTIIEEIFSKFGEQSAKSRIFVTTTPDDTDAVVQLARDNRLPYLSLELEGFGETQIDELSRNVFKTFQLENIENKSCLFETHIKNLTIDPEYIKLPGHIILILILWIEDNRTLAIPQSLTSLYQNIFKLCQEKIKVYLKALVDLDIEIKNVIKIFHVIGQSFLSSLKQETLKSTQDIFVGIEAICPMEGNVQKIISKLFDTDDDDVRFLMNKTQMQYLAASYLFSQVNESDVEELLQCYDVHNFSTIITFFVGIANINGQFDPSLASDTFTTIKNQLYISGEDFEFWWFLVSECPNMDSSGYDTDICSIVADVLEKEWNLGGNSVVNAIKLLKFTPVKPKSIRINIPLGTDLFSIPGLKKAFEDLQPTFQLHDSKDSFKIVAHFYEQFEGNHLSCSDQFLLSITEDSVVKAMKLLQLTSVKPKSIRINIPVGIDPFSIPGLLKAFEDLKHTFQLHDSKDSFKIEAHFHEQFGGNSLSYSDEFLLAITNLYPQAQLINFTGHFGDDIQVYIKLGKCYKLKSLNVRLTNTDSFNSLISMCLYKLKGLKNVHICLDIPTECDPNSLPQFPLRKGKLSLTFPNVNSMDDMSWLEASVNKITNSNGCQVLHGGDGFQIPKDLLQKMGIKELL